MSVIVTNKGSASELRATNKAKEESKKESKKETKKVE